ncbi:death ligand signal enhancer isoform X1 [Erinaceus europaeus]|uniref:DAP3-binding cell death enhancer 1 n=1 Tax=Erinaceus europaeus TaxID=9365 RepID=A0A1S3W6A0_ERIEU|nr:death ligand signal enhancer isoform X1 [Erinaceus europaeus]
MWRLPGFLGRALPRLLGPGLRGVNPKSVSPDGPQTTSSALLAPAPNFDRSGPHGSSLGTSRGPRCHGWKDAFQWMSARVSPNALWDAISWGALTVLALQLARQIHYQAFQPTGPLRAEHCSWRSPLVRFLSSPLWHQCSSLRRHILPSPNSPASRHPEPREARLGQEEPFTQPESPSSHSSLRAARLHEPSEEDLGDISFLCASSDFADKAKPAQPQPTGKKQEQEKAKTVSLEEAVASIQQLFQLSISIAFNFLGTESMKNGDYTAAFSYFQKAADRGYSKAQYNVGLCYEHGRGTPRDLLKAVISYQLAASQGHILSQYRYARCLLQEPASVGDPECQRAVTVLKQAADSGLREAQAFLGVLFTKEPHLDERKAVKYLWLAASNGDSQSMYHLGICYEKGLGVQRSLGEAVRCYQRSAALGNEPARERLQTVFSVEVAALRPSDLAVSGLKSFSSPSLRSLNTLLAGASDLPHAASTGNLGLLCKSVRPGGELGAPNRALPMQRSLVSLGFG